MGDRNHITIVVFKDQNKIKGSKSQDKSCFKSTSGGIKKINSRGVPIKKQDGRLKNLRIANLPDNGLVQLNFPVTRQSTLQNSDCQERATPPVIKIPIDHKNSPGKHEAGQQTINTINLKSDEGDA